jgi:hypothetical protein
MDSHQFQRIEALFNALIELPDANARNDSARWRSATPNCCHI